MVLEACIENLEEAKLAAKNGAQQLEVCSDLAHDGMTPSMDLVMDIINEVRIPIKIMIRNKYDSFQYNLDDIKIMLDDIQRFKALKIEGFVFGALEVDNNGHYSLDMNTIYQICKAANPYHVTIHKAIDLCHDLQTEAKKLNQISNVKFILTSGGAKDATSGSKQLKELQQCVHPHIKVIAAGKITSENLDFIAKATGLTYFHGRKIVGTLSSSQ